MEASATDSCLKCVIKKAVLIRVGSPSVDFNSGCSVIDVTFPSIQPVEIGSISFSNNYTASLSLKFKTTADDTWKICLKNFELMSLPHCEERSQDKFTIKKNQMIHPIKDAVFVRIILRQPSPHWLNFSIEDLSFFPPNKISSCISDVLSSSIEVEQSEQSEENDKVVSIANKLQQMWALAEDVGDNESLEEARHFDVDGCYDLNLLSYT